jgi:hypothetical protein
MSSEGDYIVTEKVDGGYAVNASRKTLPLGYNAFDQTSIGIVLHFQGIELPPVIDRIASAQLRFTVPAGKIGPFLLQIRVMNGSNPSWSSNCSLRDFGMPAFIEWAVEKEVAATTISSPNIASIIWSATANAATEVSLLITGGGLGEVNSFRRDPAAAPLLEVTVNQGKNALYY